MARPTLPGFAQLVENRIADAIARGEFDNLPGAGKPLDLDDDQLVPEEERVAFRIMKNAGCVPPEVERFAELEQLLATLGGDDEADPVRHAAAARRLRVLVMHLEAEGRTATATRAWRDYEAAITRRISG
jgi:hypothetical protein